MREQGAVERLHCSDYGRVLVQGFKSSPPELPKVVQVYGLTPGMNAPSSDF